MADNEQGQERKPFKWDFHPRKEFQEWVRSQFPELKAYSFRKEAYRPLVDRAHEVHEAAMEVLDLVMKRSDFKTRQYYEDDLQNLQAAYKARDMTEYAKHLDTFVDAIEWE